MSSLQVKHKFKAWKQNVAVRIDARSSPDPDRRAACTLRPANTRLSCAGSARAEAPRAAAHAAPLGEQAEQSRKESLEALKSFDQRLRLFRASRKRGAAVSALGSLSPFSSSVRWKVLITSVLGTTRRTSSPRCSCKYLKPTRQLSPRHIRKQWQQKLRLGPGSWTAAITGNREASGHCLSRCSEYRGCEDTTGWLRARLSGCLLNTNRSSWNANGL